MINVDILINMIKQNAVGRSVTVWNGWISGEYLADLAEKVKAAEPLNYIPDRKENKHGKVF